MGWIIVAWRLASAYLELGRRAEARALLLEIEAAATPSKAAFFGGASGRALAELDLAEGRPAGAVARLEPAIATLRRTGSENELALALAAAGRARRELGDSGATLLAEALEILDRLGTLEAPDRIRQELAALV
jgi:tetratricopeptide (TPR) repeat protein